MWADDFVSLRSWLVFLSSYFCIVSLLLCGICVRDFLYVWMEFKTYMQEPHGKFLQRAVDKEHRYIKSRHAR